MPRKCCGKANSQWGGEEEGGEGERLTACVRHVRILFIYSWKGWGVGGVFAGTLQMVNGQMGKLNNECNLLFITRCRCAVSTWEHDMEMEENG